MAGMSKRHFEGLAKILNRQKLRADAEAGLQYRLGMRDAVAEIAGNIAHMCLEENPAFDRARFMAACGLKAEG